MMNKTIRKKKNNIKRYCTSCCIKKINIPLAIGLLLFVNSFDAFSEDVHFLQKDDITLNSGHIRLDWVSNNGEYFILQQATDERFDDARIIYEGPDKASFISGLKNGTYFFRIKTKGGTWSDSLKAIVQYQSLTLAFTLFTIGAIVFILTTLVIIKGSFEYKNTIT